jgi:ribosome maturation factor RimP
VKLTAREAIDGNRHFDGRLESFHDGRVTLALSAPGKKSKPGTVSEKVEIEFSNIEKANLVPEI